MKRKKLLRESLKIWRYLAKSGAPNKPGFAFKYCCGCPFCEVYQDGQIVAGERESCFDCDLASSIGGVSNQPFACEKQESTYYARWWDLRIRWSNLANRKRKSWAWAMTNALTDELLGFRS